MSVVAFGNIEDHSMGVELRRGVAVYWTRGVMLEGRHNEFACRLRRMNVADPRLVVPLQFSKGNTDTFPMRLSHALVATDKGGERYRLWRGECSVPTGAMLHARHFLAKLPLMGFGNLMTNELRLRGWVLAFGKSGEVLIADCTL